VDSLQDGFFVADHTGAITEINDAFAEITGYGRDGLPYRAPYPWVDDVRAATTRLDTLRRDGRISTEIVIRCRDGERRAVALSIGALNADRAEHRVYIGALRDITADQAAAERERTVARLATAISVARSIDEVLAVTLTHCRSTLDAQRLMAVVWPADDTGPAGHVAGEPAVGGWDDLGPDWRRTFEDARDWLPLTATPVGAVPSEGTTRGFVAVLSGARDVVVGIEHRAPRRVNDADRQFVTAVVGHLGLAMQHVRQFETARETSLTLQRSMLPPSDLPPGFAVRYEPAVTPLEIGGDFYDVLPVGEHVIGITVGDCVGRGLAAAAVMGQLRASARALLLTGAAPAVVLEQLDAVAKFIPDAFCTTVFVALVDTAAHTVHYSNAGHVPPLLAGPSAPPELLFDGRSVPLAVQRNTPRPQASRPLPPGSSLLIYTDGLVERRNQPIDLQIERVAAVLADTAEQPVSAVADHILARLAPESGFDDDVALVLFRPVPPPLVIDREADSRRLGEIRRSLGDWLRANNLPDDLIADVVLVVNEACTNSIEHGYRGQANGRVRVEAEVRDTNLIVRVSDSGSWKPPPADPGTRGKGLVLIRTVADHVDLNGTPEGTTIEVTFEVR